MKLSPEQVTGQSETHLTPYSSWHKMHPAALDAFLAMQHKAAWQGFKLEPVSSFRSFTRQQLIWNRKYNGLTPILDSSSIPIDKALTCRERILAILHWSALPGASRHHWGCDIDIYDPTLLPEGYRLQLIPAEYEQQGYLARLTEWLNQHMGQFGFYKPYQAYRGGVAPEPWHISFKPIAQQASQVLTVDLLDSVIRNSDLPGKSQIRKMLPTIYAQYINNVCEH